VIGVGQPVPFSEGFESAFPYTLAVLNNPDASFTWEQTSAASHSGTQSIFINNYDYASNGEVDEYILPNLDLTAIGSPKLSFWVAYRLYTNPTANPNYSDTLEVLVSTDCGQTFTSAYKKFSTALVTTPAPFYTTAAFVPTATQWRRDSIDLAPFASFNNVVVKFRSITDYENNLYLDDINIDGTTGLSSQPSLSVVNIYPNPANNFLNIDLTGISSELNVGIRIVDMTGKTIHSTSNNMGGQLLRIETSNIRAGMYVVEIIGTDGAVRMPFTKQ
jgi:hypothetical protein